MKPPTGSQRGCPPSLERTGLAALADLPTPVLKGIRTAEDAHVAVECGVNGILRCMAGGKWTPRSVPLRACRDCGGLQRARRGVPGFRRAPGQRRAEGVGAGARAVGVGRPLYWGLAVNGAEGVHGMLELLRSELDQVLGYCGQTDVQHLEPGVVTVPYGWERQDVSVVLHTVAPPVWRGNAGTVAGHTCLRGHAAGKRLRRLAPISEYAPTAWDKAIKAEFA